MHNNKLNNIVCKAESAEHGAEIIKAFKALGVDTENLEGNSEGDYYGTIEYSFDNYRCMGFKHDKVKIVTLQELQAMANNEVPSPELTFPREMYVWDKEETSATRRIVIAIINGKYQALNDPEDLEEESYEVYQFEKAKEIPETVKMTLEQIEEKLGYKIEIVSS